jgi:NADH-quinone oxidoreductase subunit M
LRAAANVFFGQPTEAFAKVAQQRPVVDLRWSEKLPALVLLVALLFIGFWPKSITTPLNAALQTIYPAALVAVPTTVVSK